jgi:hypothetical protein
VFDLIVEAIKHNLKTSWTFHPPQLYSS